ncbi:hypothetical protein KFQ04_04650 [Pseudomonas synxantha]|nr:hypothetical protein KFQ04_04650 [Pseudomonas synxantha]
MNEKASGREIWGFLFLSFIYRLDALSRLEVVGVGVMSNLQSAFCSLNRMFSCTAKHALMANNRSLFDQFRLGVPMSLILN